MSTFLYLSGMMVIGCMVTIFYVQLAKLGKDVGKAEAKYLSKTGRYKVWYDPCTGEHMCTNLHCINETGHPGFDCNGKRLWDRVGDRRGYTWS